MAKTQILHVAVDKLTEKMLRQQAKIENEALSVVLRKAINSYLASTAPNSKETVAA